MPATGPIPKRSGTKLGHRSTAEEAGEHITKGLAGSVRVPHADPGWHSIARDWYMALKKSGQSAYFEQSDWAMAFSLADDLSYYKSERSGKGRSAVMLATIYSVMGSLLVTEGDRRRAQLELERPQEGKSEAQTATENYRAMLTGGAKRPGQVA